MNVGRGLVRGWLLVYTIVGALTSFALTWERSGRRMDRVARAEWLHRWCRTALRRLKVDVIVNGTFPRRGLVVSNHLSYLDILVFSSSHPCVFVSKSEVRSWPVFGTLASLGGTIYVDRQRRSETPRVRLEIETALRDEVPVILFPEGTSSNGSSILPFRTALFEPAVQLALSVIPAHIGYTVDEGTVATDICYWGDMTLIPHLSKLLSKGKITATIRLSSRPTVYTDRKDAATLARAEVMVLADITPRELLQRVEESEVHLESNETEQTSG